MPVYIDGLNEPSPYKRENGIFNVLIEWMSCDAFIQRSWPEAGRFKMVE
jgi:hypothetical protein